MPIGHQRGRSNFRGEGHPPQRSRVYYAEVNCELEEMFDQCTVQDVWTVSTDTNSEATDDLEVTFDVSNKSISNSNVFINGVGTKVKSYGQMSLPCKDKDAERLLV